MDKPPLKLPPLARDAHKGSVGRLLCFVGSATMPGAAILVARSAQRAGAGLVTLAVFERSMIGIVAGASPETVYLDLSESREIVAGRLPRKVDEHTHDVRVAGPGLGLSGHSRQLVLRLVDSRVERPLVLDADALTLIGTDLELLAEREAPLVLTPHPGEAARLLGRKVTGDVAAREAAAREIARRARAVCVLKGAGTVVTDGEQVTTNVTGNPGMATAGSGDVLVGMLGAYVATWVQARDSSWTLFDVAARAVHDHGRSGDAAARERGERAVIATDIIDNVTFDGGSCAPDS